MLHSSALTLPASGSPSSALVEDLRRLLGTARRHWPIIAVAVLSSLTIAGIYLAKKKTLYQTTSRLLVLQQGQSPLNLGHQDGSSMMDEVGDHLPTQALILQSPLVVGRALESIDKKNLTTRQVIGRLKVTRPDPTAKILQVGYLSEDPEIAEQIIKAVLASYSEFINRHFQKKHHELAELLTNARDDLSRELQALEQRYLELLREAPAQALDESGRASQSRRVELWDRAAGEATLKAVQLQTQLELGRKLADEGSNLATITQAIAHLGDGATPHMSLEDAADSDVALRRRISEELTDIELRRDAAERLLESLARQRAAPNQAQPADEREIARRFLADANVADLEDQLRVARDRLAAVQRITRNPSDVSARHASRRVAMLQSELNRLWVQQRPVLLEQLGRDHRAEARKAEAELDVVLAREQTLRARLARIDADLLHRLEERERSLVDRLGAQDPRVLALQAQITRLRSGDLRTSVIPEQNAIQNLLAAIERSLNSVESMRTEIQKRFTEGLHTSKQSEVDRLAIANVRANLERQRTLFHTVVDQLKHVQLAGEFQGISAQVIDPPSTSPVRPNLVFVLAVALAFGLILGTGASVLTEQLNPRLHSVEEIRHALGLSVLGQISWLPSARGTPPRSLGLIGHLMPRSPLAEDYRIVRTNLDLRCRKQPFQVLMVTSPLPGDGKTTTASNLAISLAQTGRRVLLVDADLRRPALEKTHGLTRERGLAQIIEDQLPVHQAVQATTVQNLDLISAGPDVPNPAELLTSPRLSEFLESARKSYETVIIDSPPLLTVADAAILGGLVDGILLVIKAATIRRQDAARSIELLKTIGTPSPGTVLNGMDRRQTGYGYGPNGSHAPLRREVDMARKRVASLGAPDVLVNGHSTTRARDAQVEGQAEESAPTTHPTGHSRLNVL